MKRGYELAKAGDLFGAAKQIEELVQQYPDFVPGQVTLAICTCRLDHQLWRLIL
ncbi:MAG: hypothetical protein HY707_03545 [Ignavibacteriae bacterium]|nr:hypothetical protein [Ignavibacteriota bacterium]